MAKANKKPKKKKVKKNDKRIQLNSKELRINIEKLQKDVKKAYSSMRDILPEAIKDVQVKRFGNASHIILPKGYAGKKATVLIRK